MTTSVTEDKTVPETPAAPVPGTPEYDAAMAAKYQERNGLTANDDVTAEPKVKPEWVPEKFWDAEKGELRVEELAKSYSELESKNSKPDTQAEVSAEGGEGDEQTESTAVDDFIKKSGLETNTLRDKIINQGKLDDSDVEALVKAGAPRELVEEYVNLARFAVEQQKAEGARAAAERVGGEANLTALLDWAAKTLSDDEKKSYNAMLATPEWPAALDALAAKKAGTVKTSGEPNLVNAITTPGGSVTGYQDRQEMVRDMKDPRYQNDPKFRREVEQKVAYAVWNRTA